MLCCYRTIVLVARAQAAGMLLPLRLPVTTTMQHHKTLLTHQQTMKTLQTQVRNGSNGVCAQPTLLLAAIKQCVP